MVQDPTPRQSEVLKWLTDYRDEHGISPTMREVADNFKIASATAHEILQSLVDKGWLVKRWGGPKWRNYKPVDDPYEAEIAKLEDQRNRLAERVASLERHNQRLSETIRQLQKDQ